MAAGMPPGLSRMLPKVRLPITVALPDSPTKSWIASASEGRRAMLLAATIRGAAMLTTVLAVLSPVTRHWLALNTQLVMGCIWPRMSTNGSGLLLPSVI
jgi:hypothetical protein